MLRFLDVQLQKVDSDFLKFNSGNSAIIGLAQEKASLVINDDNTIR